MSITLLLLAGLCLYFLLFCGFSVLCSCSVSLSLFNSIFSSFNSTIFAKYFLFVWPKFTIQHTFWKILSIFPDTAFRIHETTEYHRTNWIVLSSLASLDHLTKQTWLQRLPIRQKAMDKGPGNLLATTTRRHTSAGRNDAFNLTDRAGITPEELGKNVVTPLRQK